MKIEEMMQPLEEDELEEVSGGSRETTKTTFQSSSSGDGQDTLRLFCCRDCGHFFLAGGICPNCGGTLEELPPGCMPPLLGP